MDGTANALVTSAFQGLVADVVATMGVVAVSAISIAAVLLAFRYGRKILSTIAK